MSLVILSSALCSSTSASASHTAYCDPKLSKIPFQGKELSAGFHQLTGLDQVVGHLPKFHELADPAPPFINSDGSVDLYGSAPYFLHFENWHQFEIGGSYRAICLSLHYPNGQSSDDPNLLPWDARRFRIREAQDKFRDVLVAGSMTASEADQLPVWPHDNSTRRIFFYRFMEFGHWLRDVKPIYGSVSAAWSGHSYGGNLFQDNTKDLNRPGCRIKKWNLFLSRARQ